MGSILQELLPKGTGMDGTVKNSDVLASFARWEEALLGKCCRFRPDGLFIGLGFDLHAAEKCISKAKRPGIGLVGKHYSDLLAKLQLSSYKGPMVLTLEGGYTKDA